MSAVALLWRAKWRSSWHSLVALVVIVALGTGLALAAMSGARRTDGAIDVLYDTFNAADVYSQVGPVDPAEAIAEVRGFEGIADLSIESMFFAFLPEETGVVFQNMLGTRTDGQAVNMPILRDGRLPETQDEIALNRDAQRRTELELGDTLEIVIADPYFENFGDYEFEVVGVIDRIEEVIQDETQAKPIMVVSQAFVDANADMIAIGVIQATAEPGMEVVLEAQFTAAELIPQLFTVTVGEQFAESVRIIAITFGVLSVLAATATVVIGSQLLVRTARRSDDEVRSLLAVGATPRQQIAVDGLLAASVGGAGVATGVGLAIAASPVFPLGSVRRVPGITGFDVDVTMLAVGAAVLCLAFVSTAVAVAAFERSGRNRQALVGFAPAFAKGNPAAGTGIQFATGRRGFGLTVASFAIGATIAIAALSFMGSVGRLLDDPSRTGFAWELASRDTFAEIDTKQVSQVVTELAEVEQAAGLGYDSMAIGGAPVSVSVLWSIKGPAWPPVYKGRTPSAPFEVLAGRATMSRFGLELGDTVSVRAFEFDDDDVLIGTVDHEFVIVGEAISPAFGVPGEQPSRLDEGLMVGVEDVYSPTGDYSGPSVLLFGLVDGVDPFAFRERYFADGFEDDLDAATEWFTSTDPSEVVEAAAARPALIVGVVTLGAVVLASVLHGVIGFVRERPSAFVLLSAIGFTPRQIRTVVRSQGLVLIITALVLAVPAGVGVGRWLWQLFANDIGVVPEPDVPWLAILASTVGLVVIAHRALAAPARRAQRVRVADTHRET